MPFEIIMPKVDMDMTAGKISTWHASPGSNVTKGDPLFDIETDKAAMEVEAPESGILHFPVETGVEIPIGNPVAWLFGSEEEVVKPEVDGIERIQSAEESKATDRDALSATAEDTIPELPVDEKATGKIRATPYARTLAKEYNLDINRIQGTGIRGRIQSDDIQNHVESNSTNKETAYGSMEFAPLHVSESNPEAPTSIVFIHGFANDSGSWLPLERMLGNYHVIRIDLPNHGKSPIRKVSDFSELAKDVRMTFDRLGVEKVNLVGHSLGAALALALADVRPKSISTLTLIAPAGMGPEINGDAISGICRATREESLSPWLKTLVRDEKLITEGYVKAAMSLRKDNTQRKAQAEMASTIFPDGVQAFDLNSALNRVELPTCIIWGKNDALIPWQHSYRAPGRTALHLFDAVGHLPQLEIPAEVGKIITAHVKNHSN